MQFDSLSNSLEGGQNKQDKFLLGGGHNEIVLKGVLQGGAVKEHMCFRLLIVGFYRPKTGAGVFSRH